jgi:hypothetical protein
MRVGGCTPTPFHSIYHHIQVQCALPEGANTAHSLYVLATPLYSVRRLLHSSRSYRKHVLVCILVQWSLNRCCNRRTEVGDNGAEDDREAI